MDAPALADAAAAGVPTRPDVREGGAWTRGQRRKNDAIVLVVRAALALALAAPRSWLDVAGRALGLLAYAVLGEARRAARARLGAGLGRAASGRLVRRAFVTAGAHLADSVALLDPREPAGRGLCFEAEDQAVFADALAEGHGVVYVTAHLGPWERMATVLAAAGFPVATVARESYDPRLTAIYERIRAPRGVRSIYRGRPGAAVAIVRELARGRAVGFLVDLPGRVASIREELFGVESPVALGPARIALARGAAVVVGAPAPHGGGGAAIRLRRIPTSDLTAGPEGERALVARLARELERRIEAWPTAWLGLFDAPKFDTRFSVSLDCSKPARGRDPASSLSRAPEPRT